MCCAISFTVLIGVLVLAKCNYQRICGTVLKQLAVGFAAFTALFELILTLHLMRYSHPELEVFCEIEGFLVQYFATVEILFTLGIVLVHSFKVLKVTTTWKCKYYAKDKCSVFPCCDWKINKTAFALIVVVFFLPFFVVCMDTLYYQLLRR